MEWRECKHIMEQGQCKHIVDGEMKHFMQQLPYRQLTPGQKQTLYRQSCPK